MRLASILFGMMMVLMTVTAAFAEPVNTTECYDASTLGIALSFDPGQQYELTDNLRIENNCSTTATAEVQWTVPLNLTVLGDVQTGTEVIIGETFVYVDSTARPDLDKPARITFKKAPFAFEPGVLRDGVECGVYCTNVTYDANSRELSFDVAGFSNYSLSGRQDFNLYSDPEPVLKDKVYQLIDLGDARRASEYKCLVQVYGLNQNGDYILVQSNPQRQVQARMFGSPDANQPEALGYFKTENGLANVYFDGGALVGYQSFEYVAVCANTTATLVYEEPINTLYARAGDKMVARGVWLTKDGNGAYIVFGVFLAILVIWLALLALRGMWRILRGY